jgi:hypothetical protein
MDLQHAIRRDRNFTDRNSLITLNKDKTGGIDVYWKVIIN